MFFLIADPDGWGLERGHVWRHCVTRRSQVLLHTVPRNLHILYTVLYSVQSHSPKKAKFPLHIFPSGLRYILYEFGTLHYRYRRRALGSCTMSHESHRSLTLETLERHRSLTLETLERHKSLTLETLERHRSLTLETLERHKSLTL
jgi:hypothetical protein